MGCVAVGAGIPIGSFLMQDGFNVEPEVTLVERGVGRLAGCAVSRGLDCIPARRRIMKRLGDLLVAGRRGEPGPQRLCIFPAIAGRAIHGGIGSLPDNERSARCKPPQFGVLGIEQLQNRRRQFVGARTEEGDLLDIVANAAINQRRGLGEIGIQLVGVGAPQRELGQCG